MAVFFVYAMRRVDCPECGVTVERVPWGEGKEHLTTTYRWFLARWAKRLSWKETAEAFGTKAPPEKLSHDTSRIAWAKLLARIAEPFPLVCPACGGDIRLIAFTVDPGPIRKVLRAVGEPVEPPPVSPARGPPTDWREFAKGP